jgi:hypothetical protein
MGTLTSHNFLRHLVSVRESPNETKNELPAERRDAAKGADPPKFRKE